VARTELFSEARPNVTKFAVLVTDGKATRESDNTVPEADLIKATGVEVFCVGITDDVSHFNTGTIINSHLAVWRIYAGSKLCMFFFHFFLAFLLVLFSLFAIFFVFRFAKA